MTRTRAKIMFLDSNYTLEAFFWIILIAIALVTLTIFFAAPKPASKRPQDWNISHLKGTSGRNGSVLEQRFQRLWQAKGRVIVDAWWNVKREVRPRQESLVQIG